MRLISLLVVSSLAAISSARYTLTYYTDNNDCTGHSSGNESPGGAVGCTLFDSAASVKIESDSSDLTLSYYDSHKCDDGAEGVVSGTGCIPLGHTFWWYKITNS